MRQWVGKGLKEGEGEGEKGDETKRVGRKVWRGKNLLLLLGCWIGRVDRHGSSLVMAVDQVELVLVSFLFLGRFIEIGWQEN